MVEDLLNESSAFGAASPFSAGGVTVTPFDVPAGLAIAPFAGMEPDVQSVVAASSGLSLPKSGAEIRAEGRRTLWIEHDTWLIIAPSQTLDTLTAELQALAQCRPQHGSWAALRIEGERAADVLARLSPLDLRQSAFAPGQVARTEVAHMPGLITRVSGGFEVWVMRSFAQTLLKKTKEAATGVAARK